MNTTPINPGWLVVFDTHLHGCATYTVKERTEFVTDKKLEGNWKTDKTVTDVDEHKSVFREWQRARAVIKNVGYSTKLGVFVPFHKEKELNAALEESAKIIREHNATALHTSISGTNMVFKISGDDSAIAEGILRRTTETLEALQVAIKAGNVADIRKTLTESKRIDSMFMEKQSQALQKAFGSARKIAREIKKDSDNLDNVLKVFESQINDVTTARMMFVETEEETPSVEVSLPFDIYRVIEIEEDVPGIENET